MAARKNKNQTGDENRDPITDEKGAHPVGTGVGAAVGGAAGGAALGAAGAALEGAAVGSVLGGPGIGTAVGAAVGVIAGAVGGGLAGKAVAESVDPTVEEAHWRQNYSSRPYVDQGASYDDYGPAYRYGWESRARHADRGSFDEVETDMATGWEGAKANSRLGWEKAKHAARDAWDRVTPGSSAQGHTRPQKG